jgi:hypothetical protein
MGTGVFFPGVIRPGRKHSPHLMWSEFFTNAILLITALIMIQFNSLFIYVLILNSKWPITQSARIQTTAAIRQQTKYKKKKKQ